MEIDTRPSTAQTRGYSVQQSSLPTNRSTSSTKLSKEEKARASEYKKTVKGLLASDKSKRLAAVTKCGEDFQFLVVGGCLGPLLGLLAPKKKAEDVLASALIVIANFLHSTNRGPNGEEENTQMTNPAYLTMREMTNKSKYKAAELLCLLLKHADPDIQVQSLRCLKALVSAADTFTGRSWLFTPFGNRMAQIRFHELLIEDANPLPLLLSLSLNLHAALTHLQGHPEERVSVESEGKVLQASEMYHRYGATHVEEMLVMALTCMEFLCQRVATQTGELLTFQGLKEASGAADTVGTGVSSDRQAVVRMLLALSGPESASLLQNLALRIIYRVCVDIPDGVQALHDLGAYTILVGSINSKLSHLQDIAGHVSARESNAKDKKGKGSTAGIPGQKGGEDSQQIPVELVESVVSELQLIAEILEKLVVSNCTGAGLCSPEEAVNAVCSLLAVSFPRNLESVCNLWCALSRTIGMWAAHSESWRLAICQHAALPLLLVLWHEPQGTMAPRACGLSEKAIYHLCTPHPAVVPAPSEEELPEEASNMQNVNSDTVAPSVASPSISKDTDPEVVEAQVDACVLGGTQPFIDASRILELLALPNDDLKARVVRFLAWLCSSPENAAALGAQGVVPLKSLLSSTFKRYKSNKNGEDDLDKPLLVEVSRVPPAHNIEGRLDNATGFPRNSGIGVEDSRPGTAAEGMSMLFKAAEAEQIRKDLLSKQGPPSISDKNTLVHTCRCLLAISKVSEHAWKDISTEDTILILAEVLATGPLQPEDFFFGESDLWTTEEKLALEAEIKTHVDKGMPPEDVLRLKSCWKRRLCKEAYCSLDSPFLWDWDLNVDQNARRKKMYLRAVGADLLASMIKGEEIFANTSEATTAAPVPPVVPVFPGSAPPAPVELGLNKDGSKLVMIKSTSLCLKLLWIDISDADALLREENVAVPIGLDIILCPSFVESELELLHWDVKLALLRLLANIIKVAGGRQMLIQESLKLKKRSLSSLYDLEAAEINIHDFQWQLPDKFVSWDPLTSDSTLIKETFFAAWPYAATVSPIIAVIANPALPLEQHQAATECLCELLIESRVPDQRCQPLLVNILAGITLSIGGLVPIISLLISMKNLNLKPALPDIERLEKLISSLIRRAYEHKKYWIEKPPEPQVHTELKAKGNKKPGNVESAGTLAQQNDPAGGPKRESWALLLNSRHSCMRNKTKGATALLIAAMEGQHHLVRLLLECGAKPNVADAEKKMTPLMYSVAQGALGEAVIPLKNCGADLDAINATGENVLKLGIMALPNNAPQFSEAHLSKTKSEGEDKGQLNEQLAHDGETPEIASCDPLAMVKFLLQNGADVNIGDEDGNFPLHWALTGISKSIYMLRQEHHISFQPQLSSTDQKERSHPLLELLLKHGADFNKANKIGMTPLHTSLVHGRLWEALDMIRRGASPNVLDRWNCLPLHYALMFGWETTQESGGFLLETIVKELFVSGDGHAILSFRYEDSAKGKSRKEKRVLAIENILNEGWQEVVCPRSVTQRRVTENEIANHVTGDGFSALHYICGAKSVDGENEEGKQNPQRFDSNIPQISPVLRTKIAELLISRSKSDIKIKNSKGTTALHLATRNIGHPPLVQILLSAGASVDALEYHNGEHISALQHAFRKFSFAGCAEGSTTEPEVEVEPVGERAKAFELVRMLLEAGASVSLPDAVPSVLSVACESGVDASIVKDIIDQITTLDNADTELNFIQPEDRVPANSASPLLTGTALHTASFFGHTDIVEILLSLSVVQVNLPDTAQGQTPLHMACAQGHRSVVESLINAGSAEKGVRDKQGNTPLRLAVLHSNPDVTAYLIRSYEGINELLADWSGPLPSELASVLQPGPLKDSIRSGSQISLLQLAELKNVELVDSGAGIEAIQKSNEIIKLLMDLNIQESNTSEKEYHVRECFSNGALYSSWKSTIPCSLKSQTESRNDYPSDTEMEKAAVLIQSKQRQIFAKKTVLKLRQDSDW